MQALSPSSKVIRHVLSYLAHILGPALCLDRTPAAAAAAFGKADPSLQLVTLAVQSSPQLQLQIQGPSNVTTSRRLTYHSS
jgi:hypothetical protein